MSILKPQPAQSKADVAKAFAEAEKTTTPANRSSSPPSGEVRVIFNVPKHMRHELKKIVLEEDLTLSEVFREFAREMIASAPFREMMFESIKKRRHG